MSELKFRCFHLGAVGNNLWHKRCSFGCWVGKIPWRRKWQPTPVFLPGKFHGQRNLVEYSPWVPKSQTQLGMHTYKLKFTELSQEFS